MSTGDPYAQAATYYAHYARRHFVTVPFSQLAPETRLLWRARARRIHLDRWTERATALGPRVAPSYAAM